MLDIDQRVAAGLNALVGRAPVGADVLPEAERLVAAHRRNRHALQGGAVAVAIVAGVLVTLGVTHGSGSKAVVAAPLTAITPVEGSFTITASPAGKLTYDPPTLSVSTGIYAVTLVDGSNTQHTLDFDDPAATSSELVVNEAGQTQTGRVFFAEPGTYTYYCAIEGHRAAGMFGTVTVTGPPISLAEAEAAGQPASG
jgi:plastocyanin